MRIGSFIRAGLALASLLLSLFGIWITIGWRVRKTRKAFEKQLVRQGMSKKDAKRLSANYSKMKDELMSVFKRSFVSF